MWDAKVGMKVVCIKSAIRNAVITPVVGQVYTIRQVAEGCYTRSICFSLEEIPDQGGFYFGKPCIIGWNKDWFRPLQKNEKGMELLRWALNNPKAPVQGFEETKRKVKELT